MPFDVTVSGAAPDSADLNLAASCNRQRPGRAIPHLHFHGDQQWPECGHDRVNLAHAAGKRHIRFGKCFLRRHRQPECRRHHGQLRFGRLSATASVTIVVTPAAAGPLQLTATTASTTSDPNSANNSASTSVTVNQPQVPTANIGVSIGSSASSVVQGDHVTFTVMASNSGPDPAQSVILTVTLPAGMTFVSTTQGSESNGVVTVPLGDMASGTSSSVTIVAQAAALGELEVTADVTDSGPSDPTSSNNTTSATVTSVPPSADVKVTLAADHASVAQGSQITYTATVKNNGPLDAQNVMLTVNLPAGTTFISSTQGSNNNGVVTASLGTLSAGGQATISIVVEATPAGSLGATALVTSSSPDDLDSSNNNSSTTVSSNAPITLSRTIDITVGTISTPSFSGFANKDAFAILGLASTEVINAILGSSGSTRGWSPDCKQLRDADPANPTTLAYFLATADQTATVSGASVTKPAGQSTAASRIRCTRPIVSRAGDTWCRLAGL